MISTNATRRWAGAREYQREPNRLPRPSEESSTSDAKRRSKSVQEQAKAYNEMSATPPVRWPHLAEELKTSNNAQKSAEELAASAEKLSANADEVEGCGGSDRVAIDQIQKAAGFQARRRKNPRSWAPISSRPLRGDGRARRCEHG